VHICFGYAAIIHSRPSGYSFLPELRECSCDQVSIETAQSNLDCSVLRKLAEDVIVCTDCGMKYLPREVAAGKMAAMVAGARIVREELREAPPGALR